MKSNEIHFETIPSDNLVDTHGGAGTWRQLSAFAQSEGFHVTSTTGGRHMGGAHRAGRAIDVRTRDHSSSEVNAFMGAARARGITVIDERRGGNAAWSGPHLHLQQ